MVGGLAQIAVKKMAVARCRRKGSGTRGGWETAGVVFVVDDLAACLIGLLADAGRKKLARLVLGDAQERALQQAAIAAVRDTADELSPSDGQRAGQIAMVISEVFHAPVPDAPLAGVATLVEGLQALGSPRLPFAVSEQADGGVVEEVEVEACDDHCDQEHQGAGQAPVGHSALASRWISEVRACTVFILYRVRSRTSLSSAGGIYDPRSRPHSNNSATRAQSLASVL